MSRRALTALLLGLALAAPATASGHSLVRSGGGLVSYLSADATSLNTLVVRGDGGRVEFRDDSVEGGMDPGPCTPGALGAGDFIVQASCPLEGVRRVRVDLGDREDRAVVLALALPVTILGGSGADDLAGGASGDEMSGGEGNDRVAGGPGDDVLAGDQGADSLDGGDGADRIAARDGEADSIACGPGPDTVDADDADAVAADCESATRTVTAPPDVAADDGLPPRVDAGAPTLQRVGRSPVVRVYATSSERGTLSASGSLEASGLVLPIKRVGPVQVRVAGGGAELRYRLTGRHGRLARKSLRRGKPVLVRLAVVGTDQTGLSRRRDAPVVRLVRSVRGSSAPGRPVARVAHPEPGDVDGDEVPDVVDNCPFDRNGSQVNTDRTAAALPASPPVPAMPAGDGLGDACDDDDDADGVPDALPDNCRLVRNPLQTPGPDPRYGVACPPLDDDADGVVNVDDNCDGAANPDQADLDGDDRGDACDADRDGDRFDDRFDNCPTVYNLEPADIDGDGLVNDQLDRDADGIGTACDPDELLVAAPPSAPGPPQGGGPGVAGSLPDVQSPRLSVRIRRRHRMAAIRAGLVVRLRCSEACAATAELSLDERAARRLRLGATRVVAGGSARLGGRGTTYAFVRFTSSARRAVLRAGRLRATLTASAIDASGNRRELSRTLELRR